MKNGEIFNYQLIANLLQSPTVRNFKNWSTFGEVIGKSRMSCLLTHGVSAKQRPRKNLHCVS